MNRNEHKLRNRHVPQTGWMIAAIFSAVSCVCADAPVWADTVYLKNGGRVSGTVRESRTETSEKNTLVVLPGGGAVALTATEIERIERDSVAAAEFERRSRSCPDTVAAHLELAEWCRQQPGSDPRLVTGRTTHLSRVLELETDNPVARAGLGYIRVDGVWTTREQENTRKGLVLEGGRWVTPQERDLLMKNRMQRQNTQIWTRQIRQHVGNLGGPQHDDAKHRLETLRDPAAVPEIERILIRGNESEMVRILLIRALGSIGNADALSVLADVAIDDPIEEIRLAGVDYLKKHSSSAVATQLCSRFRDRDNTNERIERIGFVLGELGDPGAIGPLIDRLVTQHNVPISGGSGGGAGGGGAMSLAPTFGSGGGSSGGAFSFGGDNSPKFEKRAFQNRAVHTALVRLVRVAGYPDIDFGYAISAWQRWYTEANRVRPFDARRD